MLESLKKEANITYTENGAVTHKSTFSSCLDLFATIGGLRRADAGEIIKRFVRAYAEDPDTAMKILFYARDVRGGLGERRVFRIILEYLAEYEKQSALRNISNVAEYGRYDDLLALVGTECEKEVFEFIKNRLKLDKTAMNAGAEVSLLAKWLPSVNATNKDTVRQAKVVAKALGMNCGEYRKLLSSLRAYIKIIENNLREKDYTFDYSKQPSRAMLKYRNAFIRNDNDRYQEFLNKVASGDAKLNTGTLAPYEIIRPALNHGGIDEVERKSLDVTWNAQEDFTRGENAIVVCDGSGSMYSNWWNCEGPKPIEVAMSLAIYFAERNKGAFKNHFITFSENPQLVEIKGENIYEKVKYCESFNEVANTNLQAVFKLILDAAVKNNVSQKELPSTIYIISDMEFDYCVENADMTNFETAKRMFEENGYTLPDIIFWNVASRNMQLPVTQNEQGVALVSGCSPRVFSMVMEGELSPYDYMQSVLSQERYKRIGA
ncbi:MAG: DUF2828 family protein [Clostridia bacterium]|nr:DUF2828 family protein [Clostridia bacterium]